MGVMPALALDCKTRVSLSPLPCPSLLQNFFALIPLALILGEVTEDLAVRCVGCLEFCPACAFAGQHFLWA